MLLQDWKVCLGICDRWSQTDLFFNNCLFFARMRSRTAPLIPDTDTLGRNCGKGEGRTLPVCLKWPLKRKQRYVCVCHNGPRGYFPFTSLNCVPLLSGIICFTFIQVPSLYNCWLVNFQPDPEVWVQARCGEAGVCGEVKNSQYSLWSFTGNPIIPAVLQRAGCDPIWGGFLCSVYE